MDMKIVLRVLFVLFIFMVGVISGMALGIKAGQMILFEGMAIALKDSNVNITVDLNETEIIKGVNETIAPILREIFENG